VTDAIIKQLHSLFIEGLHIEVPSAETDLFETGLLDSLQMVELIVQLEQRFCFKMKIDEIDLDDLRTLARIARLLVTRGAAEDAPLPSVHTTPEGGNGISTAASLNPAARSHHRDTGSKGHAEACIRIIGG
jgi:D-alanine--poly(phosphoribitol) ligase subunit 2